MWRDHMAEQSPERAGRDGFVKRRVAHGRADREHLSVIGDAAEARDVVDVDEMRGLGQTKRHDGDETLPAREHAAILRRDLRQNGERLVERARHMADERRRLHAGGSP